VLLFFSQFVTDVELLAPIAREALRRQARPRARFVVSSRVRRRTPRIDELIAAQSLEPEWVDDDALLAGKAPDLRGVRAVVTATESNAPPHAQARALVDRANRLAIATATLQHGLESVGLTWFDEGHPPGGVDFASRRIFTWAAVDRLHPDADADVRARCVAVGCPTIVTPPALDLPPLAAGPVVAVCENLHWERYSARHAAAFVADLVAAARRFPAITFFVRPHPRGRWLAKQPGGTLPRLPNLVLGDPEEKRHARYGGRELWPRVAAVVTTPSTVALDAARAGRPVAVTGYDLELPAYAELPQLRGEAEWLDFVARATAPATARELAAAAGRFAARHALPGDAAGRIVDVLERDGAVATGG